MTAPKMDHVSQILEIVDENKERMPEKVVLDVMEQCKYAYKALPKLWEITYVKVDALGKNRLYQEKKTHIFEEADNMDAPNICWQQVFSCQKMPYEEFHTRLCCASFFERDEGCLIVVTGFKKWGKRARDE